MGSVLTGLRLPQRHMYKHTSALFQSDVSDVSVVFQGCDLCHVPLGVPRSGAAIPSRHR